ncbi:MAG: ACT domain-containing protein [Snowella sp.]|nr:ACT domain-containing protein [Snowella sp.]
MVGETNLDTLLKSMSPILHPEEYVFCTINHNDTNYLPLDPVCIFKEDEGLTLILEREKADVNNFSYSSVFCMITLSVHSSLEAVGFLAAITSKLADFGISVNPVSAYYHDHLFIPTSQANLTMKLLTTFNQK